MWIIGCCICTFRYVSSLILRKRVAPSKRWCLMFQSELQDSFFCCCCWFARWPELLFQPLPPVTYELNPLNYAWRLYDVVLWIVNSHNYTAHCLFIISKRMGNYVKLSLKRKAACNMTCHIVHAIQILCFFRELKVIWFKWNLTCMSQGIMIHVEDKLW